MIHDYLDPYRTTRPPQPPPESRPDRRDDSPEEAEDRRDVANRDDEPVEQRERNGYDETGDSVDEYA